MSSTEQQDLHLKSSEQTGASQPMPSAEGSTSDASQGRRKRIRIAVTEPEPLSAREEGLGTRRFGSRFPSEHQGQRPQRDEYAPNQPRQPRQEDDTARRNEYAERYQAQRSEGNFDHNYNRGERPRSTNPNSQGANANPNAKPKPAGKKPGVKKPKNKGFELPPEPVKYKEVLAPDTEIRLNKFLANAGIASRREADTLIQQGKVMVNGVVVTELGKRVTPLDVVEYDGKRVESESKVYVLLNKPKNCVTTSDDPECRLTVMDLVRNACPERIYPVGRLDRHTTGVLLITNDGDLASKLTHPSFMKKKIYHVWLDKPVAIEDMQRIADGIDLEDGEIHADALSYVKDDDLSQVGIEIHSGRNRIVRRIFEHLGYKVIKLDRVYFAGLTKKNLPRGRWRYLNETEVNNLRMGAFE